MVAKKKADANNVIHVTRRRRKVHHKGAHGGWKIAYADFVTAMMAFFLLMWLVSATTEEQKQAMKDYFNPYSEDSQNAEVTVNTGIISIYDGGKASGDDIRAREEVNLENPDENIEEQDPTEKLAQDQNETTNEGNNENLFDEIAEITLPREEYDLLIEMANLGKELKPKADKLDEISNDIDVNKLDKNLLDIAEKISFLMENVPDLKSLSDNLIIEEVPEGLKIQLVDKDDFSMFSLGDTNLNKKAENLIDTVGIVLKDIPNKIAVSGHTDGIPLRKNNYTNWELSSDRAHAARRALLKSGVSEDKIFRVEGKADTDHFIKSNPNDPRNRRISILILRYID